MAKTLAESARSRNDLKTDNETLREELGTAKDEVQQLREQVEELEQGSADADADLHLERKKPRKKGLSTKPQFRRLPRKSRN